MKHTNEESEEKTYWDLTVYISENQKLPDINGLEKFTPMVLAGPGTRHVHLRDEADNDNLTLCDVGAGELRAANLLAGHSYKICPLCLDRAEILKPPPQASVVNDGWGQGVEIALEIGKERRKMLSTPSRSISPANSKAKASSQRQAERFLRSTCT